MILFDLDGTISDPIVGISRSLNYALARFGHPAVDEAAVRPHIGPPLDDMFRAITGLADPTRIAAYVATYRERYAEVGYAESTLYPGMAEALRLLAAADIPLGVCTSKRGDFAERIVEMYGLRSLFRFVDGADVGVPKWQQIERLLGRGVIGPTAIMVGDRAVDLEAAHRSGLVSAGVLWGYGSRAELEREHPRFLFDVPDDLRTLVEVGTTVETGRDGLGASQGNCAPDVTGARDERGKQ